MAYTPTEWETGDVITAAKLNNMEMGISNAMVAADAFTPDIDNPANGDVIKYDSTAGKWVNGAGSSFEPTITNPQDGQTLVYDATAGVWKNGTGSSAMVVPVFSPDLQSAEPVMVCDMTFSDVYNAVAAGKCSTAFFNPGTSTISVYRLRSYSGTAATGTIEFVHDSIGATEISRTQITYQSNGEIGIATYTYSPNP